MVDVVNKERAGHIMTVEDPIEFLHKHQKCIVNQREVGADTHGFSAALANVLRQDPDVILVGRCETSRRSRPPSRRPRPATWSSPPCTPGRAADDRPHHRRLPAAPAAAGPSAAVHDPPGRGRSSWCRTVDGKGRAAACEVLVTTPAIRNLIREGKVHQIYSAMQAGGRFGMQTMDMHLSQLVKAGTITQAMAFERCHDPEELQRLVGNFSGSTPMGGGAMALSGDMMGGDSYA